MRRFLAVMAAACVLALVASVASADFSLPLVVREWKGQGGEKHISNGVPLLEGQATDPDELHVIGPDGKEVPAQFRVLARWWRGDNSIRWVLVDFIGAVDELSESKYTLVGRKDKAARPDTGMKVTEDDDFIRVNTGAALFEISRKKFNLLNKVQIDADLDGQYADNETVLFPDPKLGSVVEDTQGRKYYSSLGTREVRIVDKGPVRVTVQARGNHVSEEPGAFQPCLYGYEVFLTFHPGQPYCDVDAIITNNFAKPIGEPHFKDWSIVTRIGNAAMGGTGMDVWTTGYAHAGAAPGCSILLYQDSVGSSHWAELPGVEDGGRPGGLATFRGYKLWEVAADGTKKVVDEGDFARGCAQCGRGPIGSVIAPRYFWQQFPAAIEYFGDGTLRYGMLPRQYKMPHWIEDASAKGKEFRLFLYIKDAKRQYTAFSGNRRPWPHVVQDDYEFQALALPSVEYCGRAGALSDLGPWLANDNIPKADFGLDRRDRRSFLTDELKGNGYGWQAWGMRWEEFAGHSPWNYEPMCTSACLFNHLMTRGPGWLEYGLRVARQARDVRAYLIDDADNLVEWTKGNYARLSVMEAFQRPIPKTDAHPYQRAKWPLPNPEHLNLDEVYDYYLLTGNERAMRCMKVIATHGAVMSVNNNYAAPSRTQGWCLRVLMRYYDLTGDPQFKPYVERAIDKLWKEVNKAGVGANAWMGGIFGRGVACAYLTTGDERMRDVAIGQSDWHRNYEVTAEGYPYSAKPERWLLKPEDRGPRSSWCNAYILDLHAFAYAQTGNKEYLDAFEVAWKYLAPVYADWLRFLPTAQYMAYAPVRQKTYPTLPPRADSFRLPPYSVRDDLVPPAAVTDLSGTALDLGKVELTWTTPGNDGNRESPAVDPAHDYEPARARAAVYQMKYATKPILEFVPWPEKKDTHVAFWGAENVPDEPKPDKPGAKQSYTFQKLAPGKYWFAMKTRDDVNNQSPISNVVELEVK